MQVDIMPNPGIAAIDNEAYVLQSHQFFPFCATQHLAHIKK